MSSYHIAQLNIAKMLAPSDSEVMAGFMARLDEINALADTAEGFVWRLQSEDGDATSIRAFDDDMLLVNMSVWENIEALHDYSYKTVHAELIKQRRDWVSKMEKPHLVLWWVAAGHIPSVEEAKEKLAHINEHGASPLAFSFSKRFTIENLLAVQS
jgi:Domain of unknown function (DUF3291)